MNIPQGQRVRIRRYNKGTVNYNKAGGRNISGQDAISGLDDTKFILMEPIKFNVSSQYKSLMDTGSSTSDLQYLGGQLLNWLGLDSAAGVVTGVTEYSGFQRWNSTDCLELELHLGLIAENDALEEVVKPMLSLIQLIIPKVNETNSDLVNKARTLRLPGPSLENVIKQELGQNVEGGTYTDSDTEFTICVGNLVFDHVIITGVTPTIMPDTDTRGYPLSVFIELKFRGTRIPTDQSLKDIFAGWTEETMNI